MATLICLHPLPTQGGMMDSHLFKKAAFRLGVFRPGPAKADAAGFQHPRHVVENTGTSEGSSAPASPKAVRRGGRRGNLPWAADAGLPARWLLGWSFGTELALKWGLDGEADGGIGGGRGIEGAVLLSPPLRRAGDADLDRWAASGKPLVALVPELDDYLLRPDEGPGRRFCAGAPGRKVVAVPGSQTPVGQGALRCASALNEIVRRVNPAALVPPTMTLPTYWEEP